MKLFDYSKMIQSYVEAYIKTGDVEAIKKLEELKETTDRYVVNEIHDVRGAQGLLALHHWPLAVYYVEEEYRPQTAYEHATISEKAFERFNAGEPTDAKEGWKEVMTHIRAYCALQNDEFENTISILKDCPAGTLTLALAGSALTRLAYEVNPACAYPAFHTLRQMDQHMKAPIETKYKEDIFRAAYGFLTLLYTDAKDAFPEEPRIPHSAQKALEFSYKIYSMLKDEQQKEWAMEDIEKYRAMV